MTETGTDAENTILPLLAGSLAAFAVAYWVLSGDPSQAAAAPDRQMANMPIAQHLSTDRD